MDIEAFILIGGRSSRFGRDKATLVFGGTSLIERTAATIREAFSPPRISLVAARGDQFSSETGVRWQLPFICDLYENRGPIGAVHAALTYAQTEWALVLACDFPLISSDLLRCLSGFISKKKEAVAPIQPDGRIQPLCALYRVKPCLKAMEEILRADRATPPLKIIFEHVRTRFVEFEEIRDLPESNNFFLNVNTPEDFQHAGKIAQIFPVD